MKMKTLLATIALTLAPTLALAGPGCSGYDHTKATASSCVEGTVWDEAKGACISAVSS